MILRSVGNDKATAIVSLMFPETMKRVYQMADEASEAIDQKLVEVLAPSGKLQLDFQEVYAPGLGGDGDQRSAGVMVSSVTTGPLFGKVLPGYYLLRVNATDTTHMSLRQVATLLQQTSEHAERVLLFRSELEDGLEIDAFGGERGELKAADQQAGDNSSANRPVKVAPSAATEASAGDEGALAAAGGEGSGGGSGLGGGAKQLAAVTEEIQGVRKELEEVKQSVRDIHATMNKMMKMMGSTPQLTV